MKPVRDPVTFEEFADDYEEQVKRSLVPGLQHTNVLAAKAAHLLDVVERSSGGSAGWRCLDVGCGVGSMEGHLRGEGRRLFGTDIVLGPLARAGARYPEVRFVAYDGFHLPFADQSFDLVFAASVFHHVLQPERSALVSEMVRITRRDGVVAILEHNPWNPLTRLIVARCSFDRDAVLLGAREARRLLRSAGLLGVDARYVLFGPWSARAWRRLEQRFARVPMGGQYLAFGRVPGDSQR